MTMQADYLRRKADRQRRSIQDTEEEIQRIMTMPQTSILVSTLRGKLRRQRMALELTELHISTLGDPNQLDAIEQQTAPPPKRGGRKTDT